MKKFLRIQTTRRDITIGIVSVIVGFLLVTQLLGQSAKSGQLEAQSEEDLGEIIHELSAQTDELGAEITDLRVKIVEYHARAEDERSILDEARNNLQDLKISAGLEKARGPGIKMIITDSENIMNAFDFLDIVQELKVAGSEGITINGVRVIDRTFFEKEKQKLIVSDDKKISSPYEIHAIGDPETLYQGINLAGGCRDKITSLEGVYLKISKEEELILVAAEKSVKNQYAKPVKDKE